MKKLLASATLTISVAAVSFASASGCSSDDGHGEAMSGMQMDGGMHADAMGPTHGGMGTAPSSVAVAPVTGDALFVVNGGDSSVSVIDPRTNAVVSTIRLQDAAYPHHIYASHDRTRVAVAVPGMDLSGGHTGGYAGMKGAVLVLDSKTGATKASILLDGMNHNAAFSPDDGEIWTTQMSMAGKVLVLDATTLATKSTIAVGDMPAEVTFSVDGKLAFVANGMSNDVSIIDVATKAVTGTVAVGEDPVIPSPGADGKVYVDCEMGKSVSVIDPTTKMVNFTYNLGFTPGMARPIPGRQELFVTNGDSGKLAVKMLGMDMPVGETATGAGAHGIELAPDGLTAFVSNQEAGNVAVVDVATRTITATIPVGSKPNGLVYVRR